VPGTFPTISSGTAFRYPITRSRTQRAGVHIFCDHSEQRYLKGRDLTEFALQYKSITVADKELLRLFYAAQGGELATDWTLVFDGTTYTNCQFVGPFEAKNIGARLWSVTLRIRSLPVLSVVSAVLSAITSHTASAPIALSATATTGVLSLLNNPDFIDDGTNWSSRTTTLAIPPNSVSSAQILFTTRAFSGGLGAGTPLSPPDEFLIYDVTLTLTLSDGSILVQRPTVIGTADGPGSLANLGNAIDTDPSTFATITTTLARTLGYGPAFSVSGFQ
jgi:hypothetical protein